MYEHLPPDLPRLRTLETWLSLALDEVRQAIVRAEQKEAQTRRTPPPTPDWVIDYHRARHGAPAEPDAVHVGDCGMKRGSARPLTRDQALRALADGIPPCPYCRPDRDLGALEA